MEEIERDPGKKTAVIEDKDNKSFIKSILDFFYACIQISKEKFLVVVNEVAVELAVIGVSAHKSARYSTEGG